MTPALARELAVAALAGELCPNCGLPFRECYALEKFVFGLRLLLGRDVFGKTYPRAKMSLAGTQFRAAMITPSSSWRPPGGRCGP